MPNDPQGNPIGPSFHRPGWQRGARRQVSAALLVIVLCGSSTGCGKGGQPDVGGYGFDASATHSTAIGVVVGNFGMKRLADTAVVHGNYAPEEFLAAVCVRLPPGTHPNGSGSTTESNASFVTVRQTWHFADGTERASAFSLDAAKGPPVVTINGQSYGRVEPDGVVLVTLGADWMPTVAVHPDALAAAAGLTQEERDSIERFRKNGPR